METPYEDVPSSLTNQMTPLVTAVVTTYNQGPYIGAALGSVLAQTHRPLEIIVVDDGSTDDTPERVDRFRDRVVYLRQPNQGVAAARNTGVRQATGELIAFLDGDDLWEPEKLELQINAAVRHPESGLIVANGIHFEGNTVLRPLIGDPIAPLLKGPEPVKLRCYEHLVRRNFIATTSQVMVPRWVLNTVGPSDTRFPVGSDWDLYLRIAARFEVTILPQKLTRWRYLPSSASGPLSARALRWGLDDIAILKTHLHTAPSNHHDLIHDSLRQKLLQAAQAAYYYGRADNRRLARQYLLRLLLDNPASLPVALCLLALCVPRPLAGAVKRLIRWPPA